MEPVNSSPHVHIFVSRRCQTYADELQRKATFWTRFGARSAFCGFNLSAFAARSSNAAGGTSVFTLELFLLLSARYKSSDSPA